MPSRISSIYLSRMPFDVAAEVIANTRLSADYNVLGAGGARDRAQAARRDSS